MKRATFIVRNAEHADIVGEYPPPPLSPFIWTPPDEPFPIEGVIIDSSEADDGRLHLIVLFADDHAARFAIKASGATVVDWKP